MPNWKKLIVSGSDATLNSLNVTTEVTADVITANTINATTFNSQVVSSSVVFTSGSNIIGDELTDNHQITGSVLITGSLITKGTVSASLYQGDGSQLTGVQSELIEQVTVVDNFTSATTHSISHTFDTKNVNVTLYDENDDMFIPKRINTPNSSTVVVYMDTPVSGRVVISKGGHIVSGSIRTEVVETSTVVDSFTDKTTYTVPHNFGTKNVIVTVYEGDTHIIPASITTDTDNLVTVTFEQATTGRVVVAKGGHIVLGTVESDTNLSNIQESIIPSADNTYDLGSPTKQWRDLYLSSASLYIDGTKVISSNTDTLTFTTDVGQSIKLLETGGDDITLQTDTGNIELKGTVEIESGKKITDSAATMINFGNSIAVTGSILTTGTVDGIDLQAFSSSVAAGFANTTADYNELTNIPTGIISGSSQITITESQISDLTHFTDSDVKAKLNTEGVISGSTQVDYTSIQNTPITITAQQASAITANTAKTTITAQQASDIITNNTKVGYTDALVKTKLNTENVVSGSLQITTLLNGQNLTLNNLTVDGTQTILDSTRLAIGDNIIELNAGGATNGGLLVKDVTAPNNVSGSLLWDTANDYWIGGALGSESKLLRQNGDNVLSGSSQVDYTSIQNKPTIPTDNTQLTNGAGYIDGSGTANYITKWTDGDTIGNSIIYNSGTNIGIGTNSPNAKLHVVGTLNADDTKVYLTEDTTNGSFVKYNGTTNRGHLGGLSSGGENTVIDWPRDGSSLVLNTVNTERMRIDSSGNVGIGTSSPQRQFHINSSNTAADVHLTNSTTGTSGTDGASISLSGNNLLINLRENGPLRFETGDTERMRIDSSGNVGIGTTNPSSKLHVAGTIRAESTTPAIQLMENDTTDTNFQLDVSGGGFNIRTINDAGSGASTKLSILNNGTATFSSTVTATSLTETSALRFKENIQEDIDSSIIDKLRPVSYDWKENKEKDYGFIAEEVSELDSTLTTENEDGEMIGIKYTKLIPFLVKKIQEQEERIKQLENGNP